MVRALIEHGAKIDAIGEWNETALQVAERSGHQGIVKILLDHAAATKDLRGMCAG